MGCSYSKNEPYSAKSAPISSSILIRTKEGYSIPVKFFNIEKEFTLIVSHGASETFSKVCEWVESNIIPLDLANVLVFEYYACCEKNENSNENCIYSDCEALMWFITECLKISKRKIILYGKCIGAGVSLFLAEKYPDVAALVMQSSLTYSLRISYNFSLSFLREFYPTLETIKKIQCPIVFIHGEQDEVTPIKYVKEFYNAIKNTEKTMINVEGSHELGTKYLENWLRSFLKTG